MHLITLGYGAVITTPLYLPGRWALDYLICLPVTQAYKVGKEGEGAVGHNISYRLPVNILLVTDVTYTCTIPTRDTKT